ncbi:MAG: peptide transporter ATP-binding protein [Chthonomonadales bacterium]|nr:peptide transporter ATP-binding protein [Chthonomonadales bacterium]
MHVQPQSYPKSETPLLAKQEASFIDLHQVTRTYPCPGGIFTALSEIDFQVRRGEFVAIVGKSGSGKSTLLNLLTGIDTPTSGEVVVGGTPVHTLNQNRLALWRGESVGIVFQFFQLLPTLTILENVMLPMDFCKIIPVRDRKARALHLLEQVGIAAQADKLPSALSGGEQQRAAIARAQANDPPLLVADEPTGNLDLQTSDAILHLFVDLVNAGKTLIMVTHEPDIAQLASRTATLSDGRILDLTVHDTASQQHRMQKAAH